VPCLNSSPTLGLSPLHRVVSVSLGSKTGNRTCEVNFANNRFQLERIGTDGNLAALADTIASLDGHCQAIGIGGAELDYVCNGRKYPLPQIRKAASMASRSIVVDGNRYKAVIERQFVHDLQNEGIVDFLLGRTLMMCGVDRSGVVAALRELEFDVTYGDIPFSIGLPMSFAKHGQFDIVTALTLPLISRIPISWLYPTGKKQLERKPRYGRLFRKARVIVGDWHAIQRFAPNDLSGKTILTNSLRKRDIDWLAKTRVDRVITLCPTIEGESFGANLYEAMLVAAIGKALPEITDFELLACAQSFGWKPSVVIS